VRVAAHRGLKNLAKMLEAQGRSGAHPDGHSAGHSDGHSAGQ